MNISKIFLASVLTVMTSVASAELYSGVQTKGLSAEGLRQTIVSQLMTGPVGEDFSVTAPPRVDTSPLEPNFTRTFDLKIKHKLNSEHLVVIVPGFGQTNDQGPGPYLSELLNRNGYVTLVSHSPAAVDFIIKSSGPGFPGVQRWDAIDLYDMIVESKKRLESVFKYKIKKVSVIGTSLGSINAAHLAILDEEASQTHKIGFYRVFSVNPPISNAYGSSTIDSMVKLAQADSHKYSFKTFASAATKAFNQVLLKKRKTPNYENVGANSEAMSNELTLSEEQLRFLVGFGFQSTVTDALAAMDKRNPQDAASTYIENQRTDARLFTIFLKGISYSRYRQVYPYYNDGYGTIENDIPDTFNLKDPPFVFTESESILALNHKLQLPGYHLVTWEDDFLLRADDVAWIKNTFKGEGKGNSRVFKRGGHLGGYYQREFQNYLLKSLK